MQSGQESSDTTTELGSMIKALEHSTSTQAPPGWLTTSDKSDSLLFLALGLLIFALCSFFLASFVLIKQNGKPIHTIRIFVLLSVIFLSVFVAIWGYNIQQANTVIALFSAITGYLLGKSDYLNKEDKDLS
jgi:uncharacterized membrane protein